jgi:hypothetical protein
MALADHDPSARRAGKPCSVGDLLAIMPDHDRATFESWLSDVRSTEAGIWAALKAEKYACGKQQIGIHRRGQCSCVAV